MVRDKLMAMLSGFFGLLAVLLATVGLYGVIAYLVASRRGEIGIRMALGAQRAQVIGMIMREAGAGCSPSVRWRARCSRWRRRGARPHCCSACSRAIPSPSRRPRWCWR